MENLIIGTKENFNSLIESDKLTIVDFWAAWCGPCKNQIPILDEFAKLNPDVQVIKVNVDENSELATSYGIRSIPTIVYIKNSTELKRVSGVQQINALNTAKTELV